MSDTISDNVRLLARVLFSIAPGSISNPGGGVGPVTIKLFVSIIISLGLGGVVGSMMTNLSSGLEGGEGESST